MGNMVSANGLLGSGIATSGRRIVPWCWCGMESSCGEVSGFREKRRSPCSSETLHSGLTEPEPYKTVSSL